MVKIEEIVDQILLSEDPKLALVSENDSVREGCEPQIALPTFEYGNYKWPRFLQDIIDMGNTQHQRDVLLLGALTAIGSAINSRLRTHYNGKWYYACLMIFVVAQPADTLSTSLNQDYNHGSDILRNTFDHERISYNRRTDHEYRELKETFLSMVLSGTPNQVKSLIPSAENGLFSLTVDNGIFAPDQTITISDQDFFCTLSLVNKLYAHATQILSLLPAVEVYSRNTLEKEQIFNAMDGEFTRAQFLCKAQEMNINERHALTWLKRALRAGSIAMTGADTYTFVSDAGRLSSRNK